VKLPVSYKCFDRRALVGRNQGDYSPARLPPHVSRCALERVPSIPIRTGGPSPGFQRWVVFFSSVCKFRDNGVSVSVLLSLGSTRPCLGTAATSRLFPAPESPDVSGAYLVLGVTRISVSMFRHRVGRRPRRLTLPFFRHRPR